MIDHHNYVEYLGERERIAEETKRALCGEPGAASSVAIIEPAPVVASRPANLKSGRFAALAASEPSEIGDESEADWGDTREEEESEEDEVDTEVHRARRRIVYFVGIGGPSGAGKSTLGAHLALQFESPHRQQSPG